jgi:hypothetical protein
MIILVQSIITLFHILVITDNYFMTEIIRAYSVAADPEGAEMVQG